MCVVCVVAHPYVACVPRRRLERACAAAARALSYRAVPAADGASVAADSGADVEVNGDADVPKAAAVAADDGADTVLVDRDADAVPAADGDASTADGTAPAPSEAAYEIDYVLVSYVMIYVAKTPGDPRHEAVIAEFRRLLKSGVRAILVSERSELTAACTMMEKQDVTVERLIDQSMGKDERQSLFLSERVCPLPGPTTAPAAEEMTFPNVPFEEHKAKRGGAAGAGGSQTKWYS